MKIYQVDVFTNQKFKGNPAAVCVLPDGQGADEQWMQHVASEMNLSETAFVYKVAKKEGAGYSLKWFTPTAEVKLCGHATLATSHILWEEGYLDKNEPAVYDTLSGRLEVNRIEVMQEESSGRGVEMVMNFPADAVALCKQPIGLDMALDCQLVNTYSAGLDLLVEVADEQTVKNLNPIIQQIATIPVRCIIVTAKSDDEDCDFVSRVFGPNVGIDEDPVTGSTHCSLTPFWAKKSGKTKMRAKQLSKRGGVLSVELLDGNRVNVSGQAVTIFKGELV